MRWALIGAVVAVVASFPIAAVTALVYRFPIPFGGYASGPDAVVPALGATLVYGLLGGFAVQAIVGGLCGLAGARVTAREDSGARLPSCVLAALAGATAGIVVLAVLDKLIGPW